MIGVALPLSSVKRLYKNHVNRAILSNELAGIKYVTFSSILRICGLRIIELRLGTRAEEGYMCSARVDGKLIGAALPVIRNSS